MKKLLIVTISILFSFHAHGGGVSDGGGGTSNPKAVNPDLIGYRVNEMGRIVLAWAYEQEREFNGLSDSEKLTSPFAKLFSGSKNFIDVIKETGFEIRFNGPCLDAKGTPVEGSIYSSKKGFLCLSPFLMAPKLTEQNFEAETAALMVHELSHVLGADEEEANEIQKFALWDFHKIDFLDVYVDLRMLSGSNGIGLGGPIKEALMMIRIMYNTPQFERQSDVDKMINDLTKIRDKYFSGLAYLLYAPEKFVEVMTGQWFKMRVVALYSCTQDAREYPEVKEFCRENLNKIFNGEKQISVRQAILNEDEFDIGSQFDQVLVRNPENWNDIKLELKDVIDYFDLLKNHTTFLFDFRSPVYYVK